MNKSLNLKQQHLNKNQRFQEFVFIGNTAENYVSNVTKQLNLSPDSQTIDRASLEDSLLITEVGTGKNIRHQLKALEIEPGVTVKLVSKTSNGSVVIGLGNKLIGVGAEIASKIVATAA